MKIAIESPAELTDSHLEEIVNVRNRKGRRIALEVDNSIGDISRSLFLIIIIHVKVGFMRVLILALQGGARVYQMGASAPP